MRLFVSVDLDGLAAEVTAAQAPLEGLPGLSLTDPEQAHVTLKFIGEPTGVELSGITGAIDRAVADADVDPFRVRFGGLGAFPSREYIRVVWLGVREGGAELTVLHERIEDGLVDLGLDPAEHAFTPHVTLARMEHAGGKEAVQTALAERDPDAGSLRVEEVRLTESTLTDEGPVYETVERFPL